MMKTFTTTALFVAALAATSKAQVTITATDMPVPTAAYNVEDISTTNPPQPTMGANQNWNFSAFTSMNVFTNLYPVVTDPYFTAAGADVSFGTFKYLNTALGYNLTAQYDFNATGIVESGVDIPYQPYSLAQLTMATTDSLIIPAQKAIIATPKVVVKFPMTANSSWHSVSPRTTDFTLTIAAYALNHAPAQHRYRMVRNDTVVGWGKMVVHTTGGASIPYDVLMVRSEQYATDSFYLGGAPAPLALLTAFALQQGQMNDQQYAYNFYRKGSFNYLVRISYGTDNTYTTKQGTYVHRDNVQLSGVKELTNASYSVVVFPNPAKGNELTVNVSGKTISSASYYVTDVTGKIVMSGKASMKGNDIMTLPLNASMVNGNYFVTIKDEATNEIVAEKVQLQR